MALQKLARSESSTLHEDCFHLALDTLDLFFEGIDSLVDIFVRFLEIGEEVNLHLFGSRRVIVIGLDEFHFGAKSSELLLDSPVSVILNFVDFLGLSFQLLQLFNFLRLSFNLLFEFSELSVLLFNNLFINLKLS